MSFIEMYEQFLYQLRDSYGFLVPVDRLRDCLVCAEDITDVEEVCFRTQAMVCKNEKQVAAFQSLFGQTFLYGEPAGGGSRDGYEKNLTESKKLAQEIQEQEAAVRREEEAAAEAKKKLDEAKNSLKDAVESYKEKDEICSTWSLAVEQAKKAAVPDTDNECLQSAMGKIDTDSHPLEGSPDFRKIRELARAAMQSEMFSEKLDECSVIAMQAASASRAKGSMEAFRQFLDLMSNIQALQETASKSVGIKHKKALTEAQRAAAEANGERKKKGEELRSTQKDVSSMEAAMRASESSIRKKHKAIQEKQARYEEKKNTASRIQQLEIAVKTASASHREIFTGGIRAVQTTAEEAELMETELKYMNAADKQKILAYIRSNAKMFRQTLRKCSASASHRKVDMKATVKAASKTNGEPLLVRYQKPGKSHAKVVILADISGSCRHASTLALYFMAMMDEAFPGGCRKFVFVNSLHPADKYFRNRTADEGVKSVMHSVPTRGVYSDYGSTIHEFRTLYGCSCHRDTTVIILGDARNNKNEAGEGDLAWIAGRVHKVYWLNPDDRAKWDQGDSVISRYARAGAECFHVRTAGNLISFLGGL